MSHRSIRGRISLLTCFALLSLTGCVKKSTHQLALDEYAMARADHQRTLAEMQHELEARDRAAADASEAAEVEAARRDAVEAGLSGEVARLQARGEDLEARRSRMEGLFEEARAEVHRLEVLLNARGEEYRQLQSRLNSLASIQRELRDRNQIYEDVISRFRSLIDAGRLSVSIVNGRMVIHLPQDILFESGSASLSREGRQTLTEVGAVLAELTDRRFQVEGHTDNVPISTARFPSNWELSSGRALSVVQLLVQEGVLPENLSGAAYGEHQPMATNEERDGRRLNRRIEIVMLPNLNVIAEAAEG